MTRIFMIGLVGLWTAACGGSAGGSWNAEGAKELRAKTDDMFKSIDSGDMKSMQSWMDENPVLYDFDIETRPVQAYGPDETSRFMTAYSDAAKAGVKIHTTVQRAECKATDHMGLCTVEFDQMIEMRGKQMGPFKYRGTLVARKRDGKWVWSHWHGSLREMPATAG